MSLCTVYDILLCFHGEPLWFSFSLRFVELRHVCLSLAGKLTDLTKRIDAVLLKGILPRRHIETLSYPPPPRSLLCVFVMCDETVPPRCAVSHQVFKAELSSSSGDLAAAKALLAQMKYYANIEEKVKEKLSEFMWTCHLSKCVSLSVKTLLHFCFYSCAEIMYVGWRTMQIYYWIIIIIKKNSRAGMLSCCD